MNEQAAFGYYIAQSHAPKAAFLIDSLFHRRLQYFFPQKVNAK